jgi:transposase-like protein
MTTPDLDLNTNIEATKNGGNLCGKDGSPTSVIKQLTEAAMKTELEEHLSGEDSPNRIKDFMETIIKGLTGSFKLETPHNRAGIFELQLFKNHQTHLTDEPKRKIIALFAYGNSYQNIRSCIKGMYDIRVSSSTINAESDKFLKELQTGRERDLEVIEVICPETEIQSCVLHQIRNALKYVASETQKASMVDLKCIYKATTLNAAETALDELDAEWGERCPLVIKSWISKWPTLYNDFKYSDYIKKTIYTTNVLEAVLHQTRKLSQTKSGFPTESSLLKLLYAGILNASEQWTQPIQNWNLTLSQMAIHFPGRLDA